MENKCASCFKSYDADPFKEGSHNICHGYSCGHSSCGYDEHGVFVNKCLLKDCIKPKIEDQKTESSNVPQENNVSQEDKDKITESLKLLVNEFESEKKDPTLNVDNFDGLVRKFNELLRDTIVIHNKDKGAFAVMWQMEGLQNIMTSAARCGRLECGYDYPETRGEKIQYVNIKLIEKFVDLFKDNGYECEQ